MLLRRWREGEHLGRVFFFSSLRPSVTFSGWPEETTVGTPYQRRAPARIQACWGLSVTFGVRRCLKTLIRASLRCRRNVTPGDASSPPETAVLTAGRQCCCSGSETAVKARRGSLLLIIWSLVMRPVAQTVSSLCSTQLGSVLSVHQYVFGSNLRVHTEVTQCPNTNVNTLPSYTFRMFPILIVVYLFLHITVHSDLALSSLLLDKYSLWTFEVL